MGSRFAFESDFAARHGQTVQALADRGWHSHRVCGEYAAECVPPDLSEPERGAILARLVDPVRFGQTPPVNGGAA